MNKCITISAGLMFIAAAAFPQGGIFSSIKDKITGGGHPQHEAPQAPQQHGQAPQAAQPTPDPEKIREGARKLVKQLAWEKIPSNLFQQYQGKWKGDLWVYTPSGSKEQQNSVQIECSIQSDGSMLMESFYFDRISKVWATAETATYRITESDTLKVEIKRPNGDVSRQTGHYNDGQLFLTADIKDGVESYRERIDGNRYLVDGFGVYEGKKMKDHHVFIARLQRQR